MPAKLTKELSETGVFRAFAYRPYYTVEEIFQEVNDSICDHFTPRSVDMALNGVPATV